MKREDIILVGGGMHCESCIDVIDQKDVYHIGASLKDLGKKWPA
jgi:hypothetical protein